MTIKKSQRSSLILLIFSFCVCIFIVLLLITGDMSDFPVPWTGLFPKVHYPIFAVIVPVIGSMLSVLVFPRLGVPLFLRFKGIFWKRYENAYIQVEYNPLTLKTYLMRSSFVFLLTMGLLASISPFIDYSLIIDSFTYNSLIEEGFPMHYSLDTLAGLGSLLMPIVIGIWSIGWALEDSGLIHYYIPENSLEYFEIEPAHYKYDSYIGGFAGITAFLYYLGAIGLYIEDLQNLFWSLMMILIVLGINGFGYVIYTHFGVSYVRKGIKKSPFIREDLIEHK